VTDRFLRFVAAGSLLIGTIAALYYAHQGLTLSHYDAKAHLVVARRILDSLTPEYSQIGAVWLPLPHLLNLLPVQIDALYRTGAAGVAISVLSFAIACWALARIVLRVTHSRLAATIGVALFALEPDVLYLQATPMTEPLLFALTLLAVSLVYDWVDEGARRPPTAAGFTLMGACLTRYEAWFVAAALVVLSAIVLLRRRERMIVIAQSVGHLAVYPIIAVLGFFFHSWFTTGVWFVTGGFFVADNTAYGHPYDAFMQVWYGIRMLTGNVLVGIALAGICAVLVRGFTSTQNASELVTLSLTGFLLLPSYAFAHGHPFRMRYMVVLVATVAVFVGIVVGLLRGRLRTAAATGVAAWLLFTGNPLDSKAPMVQEAQWDRPMSIGRRQVTACLMREYNHEPILASMGSLAHYMQELSQEGLGIRDFIHEGNLPYWQEDIEAPKGRVKWILIEEQAEGGDILAQRARASSEFLTGFTRVCSGGGVALYKAEN
jgi:hypothetical protein